MNKQYVGDGVYVELLDYVYGVILTTENGLHQTNRIVLEAEVLSNLNDYLTEMFRTNQMTKTK